MKIQVLIPVFERPEIFEIMAENLRFPAWVNASVLAVLSPSDRHLERNRETCKRHGFEVSEALNKPLGAKMNHGIKDALKRPWKYLFGINSEWVLLIGHENR